MAVELRPVALKRKNLSSKSFYLIKFETDEWITCRYSKIRGLYSDDLPDGSIQIPEDRNRVICAYKIIEKRRRRTRRERNV